MITNFLSRRAPISIAGTVVGAVVLSVAAVQAPSQAASEAKVSKNVIAVSDKTDRSNSRDLNAQTLSGTKWIFIENADNVSKVLFFVDQPDFATITHIENTKPFDLAGTKSDGNAQGLDTTTLTSGRHAIAAVILGKGQHVDVLRSEFTVQQQAPKAPTTVPKVKKDAPKASQTKQQSPPRKPAPQPQQDFGAAPEAQQSFGTAP